MKKKILCILFSCTSLLGKEVISNRVQKLERQFVERIATQAVKDLSKSENDDDQLLKTVIEQAVKQKTLLSISNTAVDILKELQNELIKERSISQEEKNKKREDLISKKLQKVREARNLLSRANKYVKKQANRINKSFDRALKENEKLMNQAEDVIKDFIKEKE